MADNELTSEGTKLVKEWLSSQHRVRSSKAELSRAESELLDAQEALGKWLLPADAKAGEKIAVWHGDSLIQAEVPLQSHMPIPITIRLRGRNAA